jgi:hypothetical protein
MWCTLWWEREPSQLGYRDPPSSICYMSRRSRLPGAKSAHGACVPIVMVAEMQKLRHFICLPKPSESARLQRL